MKSSGLAYFVAAAVLMLPAVATAKSDCHTSMKHMLDGTLEVVGETEKERSESAPSEGCTLALLEGDTKRVATL